LKAPKVQVRSKVWLEAKGRPVLGPGRVELLQCIDEQGSISRASRLMKITYRKAWGQIKAMELQLGLPLVRKQAGGAGGGGAHLTPEARELLVDYLQLAQGIGDEVDRRFRKIFL
jgi:molybdate transport system regulatory protein